MIELGTRFGRLTVIELLEATNNMKKTIYRCKCDCGNTVDTSEFRLVKGERTSCGCGARFRYAQEIEKYIGMKFGHLTVLGRNEASIGTHNTLMDCQCDCGKIIQVRLIDLKNRSTTHAMMCRDCYLTKEMPKLRTKSLGKEIKIPFTFVNKE